MVRSCTIRAAMSQPSRTRFTSALLVLMTILAPPAGVLAGEKNKVLSGGEVGAIEYVADDLRASGLDINKFVFGVETTLDTIEVSAVPEVNIVEYRYGQKPGGPPTQSYVFDKNSGKFLRKFRPR